MPLRMVTFLPSLWFLWGALLAWACFTHSVQMSNSHSSCSAETSSIYGIPEWKRQVIRVPITHALDSQLPASQSLSAVVLGGRKKL